MKKMRNYFKAISVLALLMFVSFSVSAQYTSDGLYSIQNVGKSTYMASNGSTDAIGVDDYTVGSNAKLRIVANAANTGKYNILSNDGEYVLSNKAFVASSEANKNAAAGLIEINTYSPGVYILRYNNDATNYNFKSSNAYDVGAGDYEGSTYQWILTRIGDLPAAGVPIATVTAPTAGTTVSPSASVVLQATATVEDATIDSVEFLVDDVKVGTGVLNVDVYEYTWTAPAIEGTYAITAKATSSTSAVDTSDAVNITVATLPASVSVTSPNDGINVELNVATTLMATAEASTGNSITKVEFYEGATLLGEGTLVGDTYEYDWTPTATVTYSITAKVYDDAPSNTTSTAVSVDAKEFVKSVHLDFETSVDADWTNENEAKGAVYMVDGKGIDGSRALAINIVSGQTPHAYSNADKVDQTSGDYVHVIASAATSDVANGLSALSFRTDAWTGPTPGPYAFTGVADFEYRTESVSKVTAYEGCEYSPRVRVRAGTVVSPDSCVVYYDNMVIYVHSSTSIDNVAPESATSFSFTAGAGDSKDLMWTEGTDAKTYIDATIILRSTNALAVDPVLLAQAAYSTSDVVGDWTVLATVDSGVVSYNDATAVNGVDYLYAVVHKDLAYNYSAATTDDGVATGLTNTSVSTFKCFGTKGAIQLAKLPLGQELSIYSISGAKVYSKTISTSGLSVDVSQGIYIVKTQDTVQKVVVQ